MATISTEKLSRQLRPKGIDVEGRRILLTDFHGSEQERDLTDPPNCEGLGRVRHFRRSPKTLWKNPLPIDPALRALGKPTADSLNAQVFQNAVCNWRCWYCFVDFDRLAGHEEFSRWVTPEELVGLYQASAIPADMIDLSGGQPDLTPEWIPWMMDALTAAGLRDSVYLWSDDNLSNDYFWQHLSDSQIAQIGDYPMYGRVACFKGIDPASFAFNTMAEPAGFEKQFEHFSRLLSTGMDLYAYVTFTVASEDSLRDRIAAFVDRLQDVHPNLPLRTIPLRVAVFTPVQSRLTPDRERSMTIQDEAIEYWCEELASRFSAPARQRPIVDVSMGRAA